MLSRIVLLVVLTSIFSIAHGQEYTQQESSTPATRGVLIPGPDDILWDNTNIAPEDPANGIISLRDSAVSPGIVNTADDFVVPSNATWDITFVYSEGFSNPPSTGPDSFDVIFYENNAGLPGAVIDTFNVPSAGAVTTTNQELTLPSTLTLGSGTYWVSVVGVYDNFVDLTNTRWNWVTGATPIGNEGAIQEPGGEFIGVLPWTSLSGIAVDDPSTFFAIRGTETIRELPESQPVPVNNFWALSLMVLILAGLGMVVTRRMF